MNKLSWSCRREGKGGEGRRFRHKLPLLGNGEGSSGRLTEPGRCPPGLIISTFPMTTKQKSWLFFNAWQIEASFQTEKNSRNSERRQKGRVQNCGNLRASNIGFSVILDQTDALLLFMRFGKKAITYQHLILRKPCVFSENTINERKDSHESTPYGL